MVSPEDAKAYQRARLLASQGRFEEARLWTGFLRRGALAEHASVVRLEEICETALSLEEAPEAGLPVQRLRDSSRFSFSFLSGSVSLAALIVAAAALLRPLSVSVPATALATPRPAKTVAVTAASLPPSTGTKRDSPRLPEPLQREWADEEREAKERVARRWFHDALQSARLGAWRDAAARADAAYRLGSDTYLADDALLLIARAADHETQESRYRATAETRRANAAAAWAQVAQRGARSPYAHLARRRLAELQVSSHKGVGR